MTIALAARITEVALNELLDWPDAAGDAPAALIAGHGHALGTTITATDAQAWLHELRDLYASYENSAPDAVLAAVAETPASPAWLDTDAYEAAFEDALGLDRTTPDKIREFLSAWELICARAALAAAATELAATPESAQIAA